MHVVYTALSMALNEVTLDTPKDLLFPKGLVTTLNQLLCNLLPAALEVAQWNA